MADTTRATLTLGEIVIADDVNIRARIRDDMVDRYSENFAELPPIHVFDTGTEKVLADGLHRLTAARRLGRKSIEADVHRGSHADALVYAVRSNARHGAPLTTEERDHAVVMLKERIGWNQSEIAKALGIGQPRVSTILARHELSYRVPDNAKPNVLDEVLRAPREHREAVATVATQSGWGQRETREVARMLNDPEITEQKKTELVGEFLTVGEDGQTRVSPHLVSQVLKDARESNSLSAVYAFVRAAATLRDRLQRDANPFAGLGSAELRTIRDGLDEADAVIAKVRNALGTKQGAAS